MKNLHEIGQCKFGPFIIGLFLNLDIFNCTKKKKKKKKKLDKKYVWTKILFYILPGDLKKIIILIAQEKPSAKMVKGSKILKIIPTYCFNYSLLHRKKNADKNCESYATSLIVIFFFSFSGYEILTIRTLILPKY